MVIVCALVSAGVATVHAQEAPPREDRSVPLEEIIVTAQKRDTTIQDTPMSVSAISGEALQEQGISDIEEAARGIPGVSLTSAGSGQTIYTIRGLSSSGTAAATVGFYLDDVAMTAPTASQNGTVVIDPNLYDLNRVEVLRGPQGTLYGSGSMGGTIKLVTNQPELNSFSTSAKIEGSDVDGGGFSHGIDGMLNIPIVDGKLALRIVGTDKHTGGWIDRIVLSDFPLPTNPQCGSFAGCTRGNVQTAPISAIYHNVNDQDLKSVRAALRYQATNEFTVTASAFYQSIAQGGLSVFDDPPGTEAHYQPFNVPESFNDTFHLYNLVAEYKFPAFSVTSVSSYWNRSQAQTQDGSETTQTLFDLPSFETGAGGLGSIIAPELDTTNQFSEELRLASSGSARLQWLLGGFYSNYNFGQVQNAGGDGLVPIFGTPVLFGDRETNNVKQTAFFGEASYKVTDALTATVGLRYYSYKQTGLLEESGAVVGNVPSFVPFAGSSSGSSPKFNLGYNFGQDFLVYGNMAKGFRPGDGNFPIPTTGPASCLGDLQAIGLQAAPTQYTPDTVWSYELGEKAALFDKRITIDSAIYYERWRDVQEQVLLSCGFGWIGNVGAADVKGGEVEINAKLGSYWTVSQAVGYTHAVLTELAPDVANLAVGQKLPNVPDYTANTSLVFRLPVSSNYTLVARASNVLVGSTQQRTYVLNTLPSYDIVNARVGVDRKLWSAFLFVDNVTNKQAFLDFTQNYLLNIPSLNRISTNQPRTIGLTFEYKR